MKKLLLSLLLITSLCFSNACTTKKNRVAVSVYPMQYLVERIAGDSVEVVNISSDDIIQTATPIDNFEEELKNCDVFFYVEDLEPYMDVYSEEISDTNIELVNTVGSSVQAKFQRYSTSGDNVVVDTPYYDDSMFNKIDTYNYDPMIWMDPVGMIGSAEIIRDELIELYPDKTDTFNDNFESLEYDLTSLDVKYQELKNVTYPISMITISPSFGPLQNNYGINVYPVCLSKYGAMPSEEQIEYIEQTIINDGVLYIVHEPNLNKDMEKLYNRLTGDLYLIPVELSNITSLSDTQKEENEDYLTIMYDNLSTLEAMGGYNE